MTEDMVRDFASMPRLFKRTPQASALVQDPESGGGRILIGPKLAEEILRDCLFEGQRGVKKTVVASLAEEMVRGCWTPGMQIHFGLLDGKLHLVDGQQRMNAIIRSGKTIEFNALVSRCKNEDDLKALYWWYDTVYAGRNIQDVLRAANVHNEHDMTVTQASKFLAAVKLVTSGLVTQRALHSGTREFAELRAPDLMLEAAKAWWEYGRLYFDLIRGCPNENDHIMVRRTVVASALVTLRHCPEQAREFWRGTAQDDGLSRDDPRKALLVYLRANNVLSNTHVPMLRACALAWNAFVDGRPVKVMKANNKGIRIDFNQTPYRQIDVDDDE